MDPLEILPTAIHGGETIAVDIVVSGFLPATHTLAYHFAAAVPVTVAAVANTAGTGWTLAVPTATTVTWPSGSLSFVGMVTAIAGGVVTAVDAGAIRVTASPLFVSWAKNALTAVQAVIEGRATDGQINMTIGGMNVGFMSLDSLIKAREFLQAEVRKQGANRQSRIMRARFY